MHTEGNGFNQLISRNVQPQFHETSALIPDVQKTKRLHWAASNYSLTWLVGVLDRPPAKCEEAYDPAPCKVYIVLH
jgi:hypothetical protein